MNLLRGMGDSFALDIGTSAVRVVQLSANGNNNWTLVHYGYATLDEKTATSNSAESLKRLGEVIMTAVGQSGIKSRNVIIGLPSNKTFTTVVDIPNVDPAELKNTVKYQLDQYVPIAIDEAKVDWVALGQSMHDPKSQEILIASTANNFAEERLEFIESLGFNVIAAEPDSLAMARALLPVGVNDAKMIIDMGEHSTDLAITYAGNPRIVRTIPMGLKTIVKSASQNLNVQEDQARQFILKFGLAPDKLEGQVYKSIESTLENFASELLKSAKFFQTRYPNIAVSGILLAGYTAVLPRFNDYISAKTNIPSVAADPWAGIKVSQKDQQPLASISSEFSTVVGLAKRTNE